MSTCFSRMGCSKLHWIVLLICLGFCIAGPGEAQEQAAPNREAPQAAAASSQTENAPAPPQPVATPTPAQTEAAPVQPGTAPVPAQAEAAPAPADGQADQAPAVPTPSQEVMGITCPPEYVPLVQKTMLALMSPDFTFYPIKAMDPFVSFIAPDSGATQVRVPGSDEEDEPKPDSDRPLTPLQRMTISEIQTGLKAITWGDLGRRAIIEDSTGKGYIVAVGTPAGDRNGVITQILNDRLVIQQELWDRKAKKRFPQDFTIKLTRKGEPER